MMSNSQQAELDRYLEEKAKQEQEIQQQQESELLYAYDAYVLRESDKVRELIAEAQNKTE